MEIHGQHWLQVQLHPAAQQQHQGFSFFVSLGFALDKMSFLLMPVAKTQVSYHPLKVQGKEIQTARYLPEDQGNFTWKTAKIFPQVHWLEFGHIPTPEPISVVLTSLYPKSTFPRLRA